jgi:hypothetical protein
MGLHTDVEEEGNPILRHHAGHVTPGDAPVPFLRNEGPTAYSLDDAQQWVESTRLSCLCVDRNRAQPCHRPAKITKPLTQGL